jgi:DHA1 family bicyclomycin/chloramphenicol resistance-like MFS transporter
MSQGAVILISVLLASFSQLAAYICVPALPLLSGLFPSGNGAVIVSIYLLCAGIGQLAWGDLSDSVGRGRTLIWGFLLGAAGTAVCIASESWLLILGGRALQALGFSSCLVNSRAIIRDHCKPSALQQTFAAMTVWIAVIPALTPIAGGVLSDLWGARAPFVMTLLVAAMVAAVVLRRLVEAARPNASSTERSVPSARHVMAGPTLWGSALGALHFGALSAFLSNAPGVAQHLGLYAPTGFGLFLGAMTPLFILGAVIAKKRPKAVRIDRVPMLVLLQVGCTAVSMAMIKAGAPLSALNLAAITAYAVLQGMILPAILSNAMNVDPEYGGRASSVFGSVQMLGGALGIWLAHRALLYWPDIGMHIVIMLFLLSAAAVALAMHRTSAQHP